MPSLLQAPFHPCSSMLYLITFTVVCIFNILYLMNLYLTVHLSVYKNTVGTDSSLKKWPFLLITMVLLPLEQEPMSFHYQFYCSWSHSKNRKKICLSPYAIMTHQGEQESIIPVSELSILLFFHYKRSQNQTETNLSNSEMV